MTQRSMTRPGVQAQADQPVEASHGWLSGRRLRVLVVVASVAGVGLGYFFAASNGAAKIKALFEKPEVSSIGPVVTLDPFIVNLAGSYGERYLKTTLSIELTNEKAVAAIEPLQVSIRDAIIGILSAKTMNDLEGQPAKEALKDQIAQKLNEIIGSPLVVRVYYQDFVMQ